MNSFRLVVRGTTAMVPVMLLCSCANQIPPSGGPIDTTPPAIVETYPPQYTLHFADKYFDLKFDKYMDHRTVEESIFISPYVSNLEFDWSGKEVEVIFPDSLRKNTTYVINVGTDAKDLRTPQNRLAQAFTLAFSTGDAIDRGGIKGRVYPINSTDHPEGVMIFAYQLGKLNPDTLNPRTQKPDYVTQTGKNGEFFLQHLALGPYRILAVRDEYRNLLYDPESDEFGVPPRDLVVSESDTLIDDVRMRLAKDDTTAPRLVRVNAVDVHHLSIEFSEPIDTSVGQVFVADIEDTLTHTPLKVWSNYARLPSTTAFTVVTDQQDSTKAYLLKVDSAKDLVGLLMDPRANALGFVGANARDTLMPSISSVGIKDSVRGIELNPTILIQFSDAVNRESLSGTIALSDTARKVIPSTVVWLNDAACDVRPRGDLAGKTWYKLSILTYGATDWSGRKFGDSLKVVWFATLDPELLSSVEGTVVDREPAIALARYIVIADQVDTRSAKSYSAIADQNGNFTFGGMSEGRYVLWTYQDRNFNRHYDAGRPVPFVGSERFGYAPDTLKLRARWPLEGVKIEIR